MSLYLCIRKFHKIVSKMEQKKQQNNMKPAEPTATLEIEVPITLGRVCLPVGSIITYDCTRYEVVPRLASSSGDTLPDLDVPLCLGCDATSYLCYLLGCCKGDRPDRDDVIFKAISRRQ